MLKGQITSFYMVVIVTLFLSKRFHFLNFYSTNLNNNITMATIQNDVIWPFSTVLHLVVLESPIAIIMGSSQVISLLPQMHHCLIHVCIRLLPIRIHGLFIFKGWKNRVLTIIIIVLPVVFVLCTETTVPLY